MSQPPCRDLLVLLALPDPLLQKVVPMVWVILVSINNEYVDRHCTAYSFTPTPEEKVLGF